MLTLGLALLSMIAFVGASGGPVDPVELGLWALVVVVSLAWLVRRARRMRPVAAPWLRATVWTTQLSAPQAIGPRADAG